MHLAMHLTMHLMTCLVMHSRPAIRCLWPGLGLTTPAAGAAATDGDRRARAGHQLPLAVLDVLVGFGNPEQFLTDRQENRLKSQRADQASR
jgi:hypothetical protein